MRVTEPTQATSAAPSARAWWAVAAALFAVAWGGNEFTPLLVMYKNGHGFSPAIVDVLLFAYVLGIIPALLIGGPLSDRHGRAALMRPAPIFGACGSLVLAAGANHVPLLFVGRMLSGLAIGLGMVVGSSWLKELAPRPELGARRAAMTLTAGFGCGAGVAGALAQWAPFPDSLSYLVNVALCLGSALGLVLVRVKNDAPRRVGGRWLDDLRVPAAGHRRFLVVVVPVAPWVFGTTASAYAVMPTLMAKRMGHLQIAYSALVTIVCLGSGFAIQSVARKIARPGSARAVVVALGLVVVGLAVAAIGSTVLDPWFTLVTSAVLGAGYGMALVSGLAEVQRVARPEELAGLTAVFYSLSYLGFAVPAIMAYAHESAAMSYPVMLGVGAFGALGCLAMVAANSRRHFDVDVRTTEADSGVA